MVNNKSEWKKEEVSRGKEALVRVKKEEKITCMLCKNQTFILPIISDFPFFEAMCSKCGSIHLS